MHNNSHSSEYQSTHAWAEFYIANLGWVGFDSKNNCSPDERYIRVSVVLMQIMQHQSKMFFTEIQIKNSIENLDIYVQTLEYNSQK